MRINGVPILIPLLFLTLISTFHALNVSNSCSISALIFQNRNSLLKTLSSAGSKILKSILKLKVKHFLHHQSSNLIPFSLLGLKLLLEWRYSTLRILALMRTIKFISLNLKLKPTSIDGQITTMSKNLNMQNGKNGMISKLN